MVNKPVLKVALLTAGRDRPYALGMGAALGDQDIQLDYIGGDSVDGPEVRGRSNVRILKLRDQREEAGAVQKVTRVLGYYARLISYAARTDARILHILWNNKFELFDRTLLMWFYRLLGKRVVFTAHNVNAGERDGTDSWLNRWSLRRQYHAADHIFVHTGLMKEELRRQFDVPAERVTVIPFGINNTLPVTALTQSGARAKLGLGEADRVLLFFGNIAPYKGLEYLVDAFIRCQKDDPALRLVIAGRPKGSEAYWAGIQGKIRDAGVSGRVVEKIEFVPDEDVEIYFKAADVVVLPYNHIFQSGVLFLGYSFGLPVIATDVGSLREEIVEGETGLICRPQDIVDLARVIRAFFAGAMFAERGRRGPEIQRHANERYSWRRVGEMTRAVYTGLLR